MELEAIKAATNLGLAAFVAVILLVWKRADDARHAARLEKLNEELVHILKANTEALDGLRAAIEMLCDLDRLEQRMMRAVEQAKERGA